MKSLTNTGVPSSVSVVGGTTATLIKSLAVPTGARLVGGVRASKALTMTVYQDPVMISGATVFLTKTTASISASSAEGGGTSIDVPLTGDLVKIEFTNAGTPTTDDTTAYCSLFFKDTPAEPQVGGLTAANMPSAIDAAKISSGDVSNTEFDYLNGVTSAIQTQLDAKQGLVSVTTGLTADVGSGQGDGAITLGAGVTTASYYYSTVGTTGDAATLPGASAGVLIRIFNDGANAMDVFPASGDDLGQGADTAVSIAAGAFKSFIGKDANTWSEI